MNEDQAPRQNRDGHPCPPWCETDHDEVHGPAGTYLFHGGPPADIEVLGVTGLPDKIITRAFHVGHPGFGPVVSVASVRSGTSGQRPQAWIPASPSFLANSSGYSRALPAVACRARTRPRARAVTFSALAPTHHPGRKRGLRRLGECRRQDHGQVIGNRRQIQGRPLLVDSPSHVSGGQLTPGGAKHRPVSAGTGQRRYPRPPMSGLTHTPPAA